MKRHNIKPSNIQKIENEVIDSERAAKAFGKFITNRKRFNRFLRILGPGLITGAADDDPSGIATYSQAGAGFGYGLLWAFPLMFPLLVAVQESCARIGAVTGKGLAAVIKENYNRKLLYIAVSLVVVANTINIGADLGAMAAAMNLIVPVSPAIWAIFFAATVLLLEMFVHYKSYAKILKWLAISLFAYPITAFLIGQPWGHIFLTTFSLPKHIGFDIIYIFVGMLGTTISPYLFFWDTSEVVEEEIASRRLDQTGRPPTITKHFMRSLQIDNLVGMTLTTVTAWFIVIVCASVLFKNGTTTINTAADAARALQPLVKGFPHAGLIAKLIFSVGIVGIGLLAIPVLTGSSSYAISEAAGWKEGLHYRFKKARAFYGVIAVATIIGLSINFLGINPIKALVFTAVFNGIASIPLLFLIARVGNNTQIMGAHKNTRISNVFINSAFVVMTVSVLILFFAMATGRS